MNVKALHGVDLFRYSRFRLTDTYIMHILPFMRITFDPKKARSNFRNHGVLLSDADAVLFDPLALTREDARARAEQRFVTIGESATGTLLVVVYAYSGDEIRLISARRATANERKQYEG